MFMLMRGLGKSLDKCELLESDLGGYGILMAGGQERCQTRREFMPELVH